MTYNTLSFLVCDIPHFRTITQTNAIDSLIIGTSNTASTTKGSTVTLTVSATCHNCTTDLTLFEEAAPLQDTTNSSTANTNTNANTNAAISKKHMIPPPHNHNHNHNHNHHNRLLRERQATTPTSAPTITTPSCLCSGATGLEPPYTLSVQDFLPILNGQLVQSLATSINVTVVRLEELRPVTCASDVRQFTSFAYLDVNVRENTVPSKEEIQALERAFQDAYNRLAFESCDPFFRSILNAQLQIELPTTTTLFGIPGTGTTSATQRRRWHGNPYNQRTVSASSSSLETPAPASDAFVNSRNEGSLPLTMGRQDQPGNILNSTTTCLCPSGSAEPDVIEDTGDNTTDSQQTSVAITREDFLLEYNTELQEQQQEAEEEGAAGDAGGSTIVVVESVDSLTEGQKVQCGQVTGSFTSEVFSDLRLNISSITQEEVRLLEQSFRESYNDVSFQTCDNLFRQVVDVELRVAPITGAPASNATRGRRLQDVIAETSPPRNSTDDISFGACDEFFRVVVDVGLLISKSTNATDAGNAGAQGTTTAVFQVTGRCRNCPVTDTGSFGLFDDAIRRRRTLVDVRRSFPRHHFRRKMQEALDVCLCPQGKEPGEEPSPTTREFVDDFNDNLVKAQQEEAAAKH
ncbi:expressed unknown protein [Seminavis robusta]|uniref:Uncharacterized protein n=1 Tax=Seminavis robusta TaxID=568900 RepID=A0A9N8DKY6_9STRA|nr:expressed unknown protein [Seminavis robusta]|eukprot:Sro212_g088180.1 n/a (633) ;mRNA; f:46057-49051